MGEATLKSKSMYKATLYTLKILPMVMAFSYLMITVCAHLQVPWQLPFHYLGLAVAPLVFMYLTSYVFKFCEYHRIFIHYVLILEILTTVKWYYPVIVTSELVLNISFVLSGLLMLCVIFFNVYKIYKKYRRPSN